MTNYKATTVSASDVVSTLLERNQDRKTLIVSNLGPDDALIGIDGVFVLIPADNGINFANAPINKIEVKCASTETATMSVWEG